MNRLVSVIINRRFVRWVVLPHSLFFAVAWWTKAKDLIGVLNRVDIALSVAVCIAFLSSMVDGI